MVGYLENPAGVVDGPSDGAQVQPKVGAQRRHLLLGVLGDHVHVEAGECLPVEVSFLEDGSPVCPDLHAGQREHLEQQPVISVPKKMRRKPVNNMSREWSERNGDSLVVVHGHSPLLVVVRDVQGI
uniref:DNA-3-methyladenine glycosylase I n=1 Tax=Arundo donax TaxID=35708 RepID=A0A0A9D3C7_ARUDO